MIYQLKQESEFQFVLTVLQKVVKSVKNRSGVDVFAFQFC